MKTRIHLPDSTPEQRRSLRRETRSLLGAKRRRIDSVEIRGLDMPPTAASGGRLCEITVRFRQGGFLSLVEQEAHVGRALLRAAWRAEQRCELGHRPLAPIQRSAPAS